SDDQHGNCNEERFLLLLLNSFAEPIFVTEGENFEIVINTHFNWG
ncbi:MAG: hypothetical protein JWQ25_3297, partial [Daejeonella sp.]|nr:hypothetical protein [Daejeonella sp.]